MIYLASYKSTRPGLKGLGNWVIRWVTQSLYSHNEICLGNPFASKVVCLSSSMEDGGVRSKIMQLNPDKWDIVPLPWVTSDDVEAVALLKLGVKYDYLGAIRFAFPWLLKQSKTREFCSELCAEIMGLEDTWRYYPGLLHKAAKDINAIAHKT
jgi:hypothetical protein